MDDAHIVYTLVQHTECIIVWRINYVDLTLFFSGYAYVEHLVFIGQVFILLGSALKTEGIRI